MVSYTLVLSICLSLFKSSGLNERISIVRAGESSLAVIFCKHLFVHLFLSSDVTLIILQLDDVIIKVNKHS